MRDYDWITFDCYGTLIDWESGITTAFEKAFIANGVPFDRAQVLNLYHKYEAQEEKQYKRYRDVLTNIARRICEEQRAPFSNYDFLAGSVPDWPPFPDTNRALQRLAEHYRLGILSNIDNDLLAETRRHLMVRFALVVTAQNVSSYKPGHAHFAEARKAIGNRKWLHTAQSYYHDLVPCRQLDIPSAWINRTNQTLADPDVAPLFNGPDLGSFADWMLY